MDETTNGAPLTGDQREALQHQLKAGSETVVAQDQSDAEELGKIAARPVVTATGEVMTPEDVKNELKYRQLHHEPSNR